MSSEFCGKARPLDTDGLAQIIDRLGIKAAELWAVLNVETRGCGFLPDRRPLILFERHIFSRETKRMFDAAKSNISNPLPGGYGTSGAGQYDRLNMALALDRKAALRSASWGIGQLMGFNAEIAGYKDVETMVVEMANSENQQLMGMAGEIAHNKLARALRNHDWTGFARGYNGPAYAKNNYDSRLACAYQKYVAGSLPDLAVRAAQIYLTFLGYHPGTVDGIMGRFTRSALSDFQLSRQLPVSDQVDDESLELLKQEVEKLL